MKDIDRKVEKNKTTIARDRANNVITMDDVVKCVGEGTPHRGLKGVIVGICRNCVFLWDSKNYSASNGVFAEKPINLIIAGSEFLKSSEENGHLMTQNRILRDKLLNKPVKVIQGRYKGYLGRVNQVNGEEAQVELTSRGQVVTVLKIYLSEIEKEASTCDMNMTSDHTGVRQWT